MVCPGKDGDHHGKSPASIAPAQNGCNGFSNIHGRECGGSRASKKIAATIRFAGCLHPNPARADNCIDPISQSGILKFPLGLQAPHPPTISHG
jgi:hypothetical protein